MSIADLDNLLTTPLGKQVRKKKKKKKKKHTNLNELRMKQIETAAERAREWRLTAHPYEVRLFVQRTHCLSCRNEEEATISLPLIAYKDKLNRVQTQQTHYLPPSLPVVTNYIDLRVPICHRCATDCCPAARPYYQPEIRFDKTRQTQCKALQRIHETPQAVSWIFWALSAETFSYEEKETTQ